MPIVPMFQGGVTQERDAGRDHAGEVQLARPTFDYAKNMEKALTPIAEAGKSITKAAEIIANRNVKAEADEAEQKYLDIERRILYGPQQSEDGADNGFYRGGSDSTTHDQFYRNGPVSLGELQDSPLAKQLGSKENDEGFYRDIPNGFFGQQGRGAVDTYDKSIQGLKKEAKAILDNLSPWARESLKSRIADRLNSAETRMLQWRQNQEQKWHISSAQSRIDSLIRSAGDNPNNAEYLAKTQASIDEEVQYIGKLQGLDDQQISELRNKYRDLAQASRFTAWAQDNPIGALEAFQNESKGISRDVAQKLSDELFRAAKPQLGMMLSQQYGDKILDQKDFLRDVVSKGKKTGIPTIDKLSTVQKASLWSSAHAFVSQQRAVAKSSLAAQEKNTLSEVSTYGTATTVPDKDDYVAAYGKEEGEKAYKQFQDKMETTTSIHNYAGMTDEEIRADIEAAKPVPGAADFADQKALYDARTKAAEAITKARREDSVGFAVSGGQMGFQPLNLQKTDELISQLRLRVEKAGDLAKAFGSSEKLLSKGETSALCSILDSGTVEQRVSLLSTMAAATGTKGIKLLADQLKGTSGNYAIAMAGMDISLGTITAGEKFLRGLDYIETKRVKIDASPERGTVALIAKEIGDEPAKGVLGVMDSPEANEMTRKMALGIYAYNVVQGEGGNAPASIAQAMGGTVARFNNRKIVLPKGYEANTFFGEDFNNLIAKQANVIRENTKENYSVGIPNTSHGNAYTASEIADKLQEMNLKTEKVNPDGSVTYSLFYGTEPVYKSGGKLYTFTLSAKKEK